MKFLDFLKEAFIALSKHPKLFVPKIIIAAIYGVSLILGAFIIKGFLPLLEEALVHGVSSQYTEAVNQAMPFLLFTMFWALFSLIADIFVNAMYPALLLDFKDKKPISLSRGFSLARKRAPTVVPAALIIIFFLFAPFLVLSEIAFFISKPVFLFLIFITLLVAFFFGFIFYYAYPVLVLEKVSIFEGLKKSVFLSRKNASLTIKATTIPFIISFFNLYLAFDIFNPVNFILFVTTRFLIAVASAYHMVLNPMLYFGARWKNE